MGPDRDAPAPCLLVIRVTDHLSPLRHQLRWLDHAAAWGLALVGVLVLLATTDMGFTRDESFYFRAATDYAGWFIELEDNWRAGRLVESFTQANIDRHWGYNPEHPVLLKALFGLSHLWLHERWDLLSASDAMRFPAIAFTGVLLAVLYLFTLEVTGRRLAAVLAPVLLMATPRFFFHAHLTCFDVPMTAIWVVMMYVWWKSLDRTGWAIAAGVVWGIALITKLNAFFIPFVLLAHWAIGGWRRFSVRGGRLRVPQVPTALFWMISLGPLIFYLGWPRHWFDTYERVRWYFNFHLKHEHYFQYYFGQNLWEPPFPVEFPFVLTLTSTPLPILAAWFVGIGWVVSETVKRVDGRWQLVGDRFATGTLIALNIVVPFLIIARPSTPIFGGVKHWFPALLYLCLLGAYGICRTVEVLVAADRTRLRAGVAAALSVVVLAPSIAATHTYHAHGTAYWNAVVGGISGAADRRAMRQFWGYASRDALDWINEHAPPNARVAFQNTTPGAMEMYQREGWLRDDIRYGWNIERSDLVVYHHQKSFFPVQSEIFERYETWSPSYTVTLHGVPLVSVYARSTGGTDMPSAPVPDIEPEENR